MTRTHSACSQIVSRRFVSGARYSPRISHHVICETVTVNMLRTHSPIKPEVRGLVSGIGFEDWFLGTVFGSTLRWNYKYSCAICHVHFLLCALIDYGRFKT